MLSAVLFIFFTCSWSRFFFFFPSVRQLKVKLMHWMIFITFCRIMIWNKSWLGYWRSWTWRKYFLCTKLCCTRSSCRDGEKNSSHTRKVWSRTKQSGPHDTGYICGLFIVVIIVFQVVVQVWFVTYLTFLYFGYFSINCAALKKCKWITKLMKVDKYHITPNTTWEKKRNIWFCCKMISMGQEFLQPPDFFLKNALKMWMKVVRI